MIAHGTTEIYDDTRGQYRNVDDVWFTRIHAYTQRQSTGRVQLERKANTTSTYYNNITNVNWTNPTYEYRDGTYRVNTFRDMLNGTQEAIMSTDWQDLAFFFAGTVGYRDKTENSNIHDYTSVDLYNKGTLRDRYVYIRLEQEPAIGGSGNQPKITTDIMTTLEKIIRI